MIREKVNARAREIGRIRCTMADDPTKRGPADRIRIDPEAEHEVKYWSEKFGVSPGFLKEVVARVGPMVDDVEKALKQLR